MISTETKRKIIELAEKGVCVRKINSQTGVSQATIYQSLHKRGVPPSHWNKYFIDESILNKSSKEREYFLGLTFRMCSNRIYRQGNSINYKMRWESRQIELIEIIKSLLKSEHSIRHDKGGNFRKSMGSPYIEISYKKLDETLIKLGVHPDKKLRTIPEISKTDNFKIHPDNLSHFVRGLSDAGFLIHHICPYKNTSPLTITDIKFPSSKLTKRLENILVTEAGVTQRKEIKNKLSYSHQDSIKIHNFIYQDWDWIEKTGLYLESKKDKFLVERKCKLNSQEIITKKELKFLKSPDLNFTDEQIANLFDYHFGTIQHLRNTYGIPSFRKPRQKTEMNRGKIKLLFERDYSIPDIAKLFGCDSKEIIKFCPEDYNPQNSCQSADA